MSSAYLGYAVKKLTDYLALKSEMVNHRSVIKEVATGVERSWVYYLILVLAGLIALMGLQTNSVAVVIGAMLISPLMGPIISSSLALTIGDLAFARRAFKTVAVSVALTIGVTAVFSVISPLKDPTPEILSRVRPNIFDLFVAMLSGIAGAVALCTKRNYLLTATGVAVATAVIPPLSVTGYGLGTGQLLLASGGFLLFFTNCVAIILTSDLVFFILGFRTSHGEAAYHSPRKRILTVASLLILVSIPLVYTMVVDISKVKEKKKIEVVLKQHLDKGQDSRLTGYDFLQKRTKIQVTASVNTVKFIEKPSIRQMEQELTQAFKRPVSIHLEQLIVASGEVQQQPVAPKLFTGSVMAMPPPETPAQMKSKVASLVNRIQSDLAEALTPFPVTETRLAFSGDTGPVQVSTTLKRDYSMGDDERLLLTRLLERSLGVPVSLAVTMVPLLPPVSFDESGALTPACISSLSVIKRLPGGAGAFRYEVDGTFPRKSTRLKALKLYLVHELGVPADAIVLRSLRRSPNAPDPTLRIVRR